MAARERDYDHRTQTRERAMNRLQRAAILLTLLDALRQRGSWCGETHLQKSVYFLEEMCGVPLGFPICSLSPWTIFVRVQ